MAVEYAISPPEGLTDDEVAAWEASLPEPPEVTQTDPNLTAQVAQLEVRLEALEKLLNVNLAAQAADSV